MAYRPSRSIPGKDDADQALSVAPEQLEQALNGLPGTAAFVQELASSQSGQSSQAAPSEEHAGLPSQASSTAFEHASVSYGSPQNGEDGEHSAHAPEQSTGHEGLGASVSAIASSHNAQGLDLAGSILQAIAPQGAPDLGNLGGPNAGAGQAASHAPSLPDLPSLESLPTPLAPLAHLPDAASVADAALAAVPLQIVGSPLATALEHGHLPIA